MMNMSIDENVKSLFLYCIEDEFLLKKLTDKLGVVVQGNPPESKDANNIVPILNKMDSLFLNKVDLKLDKVLESLDRMEKKLGNDNVEESEDGKENENGNEEENIIALIEDKTRLELENQELKKKLIEKENNEQEYEILKEQLEIWKMLNSLPYEQKKYIEDLCGGIDILAIMSLGRDEGKIEQLWDYLREISVKSDFEEKGYLSLKYYFEFCLKVFNTTRANKERYDFGDISLGSDFDMTSSIRTADSKQIGLVSEVRMRCIRIGEKIKFKAIVKVE